MRFVILLLLALSGVPASADPASGLEALRAMYKDDKVRVCQESTPKDEAFCVKNKTDSKSLCDRAQQHVKEVSDESNALIASLSTDVAKNAKTCGYATAKIAEAIKMAKEICTACAKSCFDVCKPEETCRSLYTAMRGVPISFVDQSVAECKLKLSGIQTNSCGAESKPKDDTIRKTALNLGAGEEQSIADNAKCVATRKNADTEPVDGDPAKPVDDTGGGGNQNAGGDQGQQQQQAKQEDTGAEDEGDTKKDDKKGGGAGGTDPSALSKLFEEKEKEEEADVECSKETAPYSKIKCAPDVVKACTGTDEVIKATDGCRAFAAHFCVKSGKTPGAGETASGEGFGTEYCNDYNLENFCKTGGRENVCAGCAERRARKACASAGSPVGCAADPSCGTAKAAAAAGILCTGDPYLLSANYISACVSGGLATGAAGFTNSTPTTGLAPGSVGGGGGMGSLANATGAVTEAAPDDTGNREGLNLGVDSQGGYSDQSAGQVTGEDEGGGYGGKRIIGRAVASSAGMAPNSMPTDVAGAMGPNPFTIISSVLKIRCEAFKHHHCEPR